MNKTQSILLSLCLNLIAWTALGQTYLEKFTLYNQWSENLPRLPDPSFIAFVDDTTPLSGKLREKWLYQLAYNKDWTSFNQHYQTSNDISLQCYAEIARYQQGARQEAVQSAQKLWLNGNSQPKSCDVLFAMLQKNHELDEKLITERLILALNKQNLPLATHLLRQFKPARLNDIQALMTIHQNPTRITELKPSLFHNEFYLYGLKRMVASTNMEKAIQLWQRSSIKAFLNTPQKQAFIAHVALYKALRNEPDATAWFSKVKPAFYNDELLSWQIRFALNYKQWAQVEKLIYLLQDKDNPCWQYWLARAMWAQGEKEKATTIYQSLAKLRSYYGFLASLKLKQNYSFDNEQAISDQKSLRPYQSITHQIKILYASKHTTQASKLINDFISELPKDDKSALAYWLDHDLQWHDKAVYLSNTDDLNNQLSLRFPLAYRNIIIKNAKNYEIPQEMIYAIIRQESAFRDDAISTAGAQGLMQLMPATAKVISKREKITYLDKKQLFSSQKNINIGTAYLQELAKRFHQHPILMIAAYNAGPKQVSFWLKNHPPKEIDIWIETLPWHETRNYLKNVIAFYAVYQYRMQEKPDLTPFMKGF